MSLGSMDIRTRPGTKVVFSNPENGYDLDREEARKYLKLGTLYTISHMDIGQSLTHVYLAEVPGVGFNSVLFDNIEQSYVLGR